MSSWESSDAFRCCSICGADVRMRWNLCCIVDCQWFKDNDFSSRAALPCACSLHGSIKAEDEQNYQSRHQNVCNTHLSTASLPEMLDFRLDENGRRSVVCRLPLPTRTLFGPFIAPLYPSETSSAHHFAIIDSSAGPGSPKLYLAIDSDDDCNWMKHVRFSPDALGANLGVVQHGGSVYFVVVSQVAIGEELVVAYGEDYRELLTGHDKVLTQAKKRRGRPRRNEPVPVPTSSRPDADSDCESAASDSSYVPVRETKPRAAKKGKHKLPIPLLTLRKVSAESTLSYECVTKNSSDQPLPLKRKKRREDDADPIPVAVNDYFEAGSSFVEPDYLDSFPIDDGSHDVSKEIEEGSVMKSKNKTSKTTKSAEKKGPKEYPCHYCDVVLRRAELSEHQKIHEVDGKYRCPLGCKKYLLRDADHLSAHLRAHKRGPRRKLFSCKYCGLEMTRPELWKHNETHMVDGMYPCPTAGCLFKHVTRLGMNEHMNTVHIGPHVCDVCGLRFKRKVACDEHKKGHEKPLPTTFTCQDCGEVLSCERTLKRHLERMHSDDTKRMKRTRAPNLAPFRRQQQVGKWESYFFKCQPCQMGFYLRKGFIAHLDKHHPEVPKFSIPELNLPMKVCTMFLCRMCSRWYKTEEEAKAHIEAQHGEEECRETRERKLKNLNKDKGILCCDNLVLQRPTETYYCDFCERPFSGPRHFLQHMKNTHSEYHDILMPHMPKDVKYIVLYNNAGKKRKAAQDGISDNEGYG